MNEEEKENTHQHNHSFRIGLFLGGLIGGVVIFFLGTKEGRKLSKEIHGKGEGWFSDFESRLYELEKKGLSLLKDGELLKNEVLKSTKVQSDKLSKKAIKKADETLAHIEKIQERGRKTTSSIRKRLFKNVPKK